MSSIEELLDGKIVLATVMSSVQKHGYEVVSVEIDGTTFDTVFHFSEQKVGSMQRVNLEKRGDLETIKFV